MKKIIIIFTILIFGTLVVWLSDTLHEPIESIEELIGKEYSFAHDSYFKATEDDFYIININDRLSNFDFRVFAKRDMLSDPSVHVYTWHYFTHKCTIWIGTDKESNTLILDAIRYQNDVKF